eukprot:maker-scaffold_10-snap-gene-6.45-mRNA-1 protein AED:0.00 eAED:0.00 QI:37/1/1/1/1/1/2/71/742
MYLRESPKIIFLLKLLICKTEDFLMDGRLKSNSFSGSDFRRINQIKLSGVFGENLNNFHSKQRKKTVSKQRQGSNTYELNALGSNVREAKTRRRLRFEPFKDNLSELRSSNEENLLDIKLAEKRREEEETKKFMQKWETYKQRKKRKELRARKKSVNKSQDTGRNQISKKKTQAQKIPPRVVFSPYEKEKKVEKEQFESKALKRLSQFKESISNFFGGRNRVRARRDRRSFVQSPMDMEVRSMTDGSSTLRSELISHASNNRLSIDESRSTSGVDEMDDSLEVETETSLSNRPNVAERINMSGRSTFGARTLVFGDEGSVGNLSNNENEKTNSLNEDFEPLETSLPEILAQHNRNGMSDTLSTFRSEQRSISSKLGSFRDENNLDLDVNVEFDASEDSLEPDRDKVQTILSSDSENNLTPGSESVDADVMNLKETMSSASSSGNVHGTVADTMKSNVESSFSSETSLQVVKYKPKLARGLEIPLIPEPEKEKTPGKRRSTRRRMKPVKFWLGERAVSGKNTCEDTTPSEIPPPVFECKGYSKTTFIQTPEQPRKRRKLCKPTALARIKVNVSEKDKPLLGKTSFFDERHDQVVEVEHDIFKVRKVRNKAYNANLEGEKDIFEVKKKVRRSIPCELATLLRTDTSLVYQLNIQPKGMRAAVEVRRGTSIRVSSCQPGSLVFSMMGNKRFPVETGFKYSANKDLVFSFFNLSSKCIATIVFEEIIERGEEDYFSDDFSEISSTL